MNETITIRRATIDDLKTVVRYNAALAKETEDQSLDRSVLTSGVRRALQDDSLCVYYIAELGGEPVGQTAITFEWSDWRNGLFWWIQSVYVDDRFRRKGVFRALYAHVQAEAKSQPDVCGLRLYVIRDNTRALDTYRNLGMTVSDYLLCEEDWAE